MQSIYLNDSLKCKYKYTNRVSTASLLSTDIPKGLYYHKSLFTCMIPVKAHFRSERFKFTENF